MGTYLVVLLMPDMLSAVESEDRVETYDDLALLGFALLAYRADQGAYPDELSLLAPKYIPKIPTDPANGQPYRYHKLANGFSIYSVGENGIDDRGSTYDSQPPGDDLTLYIDHGL